MSTTDEAKFNAFMNSINNALNSAGLGLTDNGESTLNYNGNPMNFKEALEQQKEAQLNAELKEAQEFLENNTFGGDKLSQYVSASKSNEGIILTIKDIVLFDSGSAEVKVNSKALLEKLAPLIEKRSNGIRVEGHTDNVQLSEASQYEDNWELSTARASRVVAFILEQKMTQADKISIAGYAEFKPVANNDTPENKAKNRRVDIVLKSDFTKAEKEAQDAVDKANEDKDTNNKDNKDNKNNK